MAEVAFPISIDLDYLHKHVLGSKNESLYESILCSSIYKQFEEDYAFKKELKELIFSYIQPESRKTVPNKFFGLIKGDNGRGLDGEWVDYGFALLCLCHTVGKPFETKDSQYIYSENWWEINTKLREIKSNFDLSRLLKTKCVFDVPFEQHDIYTNYFDKFETKALYRDIVTLENHAELSDNKLFQSFKNGLDYSQQNQHGVVIFSLETSS